MNAKRNFDTGILLFRMIYIIYSENLVTINRRRVYLIKSAQVVQKVFINKRNVINPDNSLIMANDPKETIAT